MEVQGEIRARLIAGGAAVNETVVLAATEFCQGDLDKLAVITKSDLPGTESLIASALRRGPSLSESNEPRMHEIEPENHLEPEEYEAAAGLYN